MKNFTDSRSEQTADEFWLLEHPPVFTQGQAGKPEHVLDAGDIPLVQSDRGGQVTYHGPGQLVLYTLVDIKRLKIGVRQLVTAIEQSLIRVLADLGLEAEARSDAPGVYVQGKKIASLGLRLRKGCSYHGLSFNLDMDLTPFSRINVCGHQGLEATRLVDWVRLDDLTAVWPQVAAALASELGYSQTRTLSGWDHLLEVNKHG